MKIKKNIKVIVLPTYKTNSTYNLFLYSNDDTCILDIVKLDELLSNLSFDFNITQIYIAGGEISLLSDFYFTMVYNLLKQYCKKIQVFTNFININKGIINNCEVLNVLVNLNKLDSTVIENLKAYTSSTSHIVNLKSFDYDCKNDILSNINKLNTLNVKSFEIIPSYKMKQGNIYFEDIVKEYLKYSNKMKFAFQNELQLKGILNLDNYNTQIVYITPNNKYGIQEEKDNKFYLEEYDTISDIQKKIIEKEKFSDNFCKNCTSKLTCMRNYVSNYNENNESCCGFKNLINDYSIERSKNEFNVCNNVSRRK